MDAGDLVDRCKLTTNTRNLVPGIFTYIHIKMNSQLDHRAFSPITYSCYTKKIREGEQFIPDHVFSFQISGSLTMNDGQNVYSFDENSFRLTRRNSLMKFLKQPGPSGAYRNLSVFMSQQLLKELSFEYGYRSEMKFDGPTVLAVAEHTLLRSYFDSLQPYDELIGHANPVLTTMKVKELVVLLLQLQPNFKNLLFNFSEPGKLDLEAFMNQNFRFNVSLERFAYLTGRSLSTFKRDFEKVYSCKPGKWLQQRRLQEAYFLIKDKRMRPIEVYTEVGFEDLSHFSYAFKKQYGSAPGKLNEVRSALI